MRLQRDALRRLSLQSGREPGTAHQLLRTPNPGLLAGSGGLARPDYTLTWTELPSGLSEPNADPPSRTRPGAASEYVMTAEAWRFNAEHRPTEHHRKGQVDLTGDEQWVELEWGAYDAAEEGQQLLGRVSWAESRVLDRLEESFTYGAGWSERTGTTQTRMGAAWPSTMSRSTSTSWSSAGEVLSELDPDGRGPRWRA